MSAAFESENSITVKALMSSLESVVAAPVGTAANWKGADNYTKKSFPAVLQAAQSEYDDDNKQITSYVSRLTAFSLFSRNITSSPRFPIKTLPLPARSVRWVLRIPESHLFLKQ